jgi:predicted metal-dependent HD superfamily phosphohydrolase
MQSRWNKTWQQLGIRAPEGAFAELSARYSESHRRYHTLQHLTECFALFDSLTTVPMNVPAVELALWFHDAIYDTRATDNEEASANLGTQVLLDAGCSMPVVALVRQLILATRHEGDPGTSIETMVLLDVDLSILGATPDRFEAFEAQIRAEYHWVPSQRFREGRAAILRRLLARASIYQLPQIRSKLEAPARRNLAAALARLED